MAVEALATPAQLRSYLRLEPDDVYALTDDDANRTIAGISKRIIGYIYGPYAETLTIIENEVFRLDGNGARELLLPKAPVIALASVTLDPDETDGDPVDITASVEWSQSGILRYRGGACFPFRRGYIEAVATAGYATIPEDITDLCLRLASRAVSNPEGLVQESVEGYSASFAFDETRLPTLTAPDRRDLDHYRL